MGSQRATVRMTDEEVAALLAYARKVQIATINPDGTPHLVADISVRGDRGGDRDDAMLRERLGDPADATNIGVAILLRKAEALR